MADRDLLFLVLPILPLVAAALTALVVAGLVRRDFLLVCVPAAALAAVCVVVIGLPVMESLYTPPPGAGGPWAGGGTTVRLMILLAVVYGVLGGLMGLVISAVAFATRSLGARK